MKSVNFAAYARGLRHILAAIQARPSQARSRNMAWPAKRSDATKLLVAWRPARWRTGHVLRLYMTALRALDEGGKSSAPAEGRLKRLA